MIVLVRAVASPWPRVSGSVERKLSKYQRAEAIKRRDAGETLASIRFATDSRGPADQDAELNHGGDHQRQKSRSNTAQHRPSPAREVDLPAEPQTTASASLIPLRAGCFDNRAGVAKGFAVSAAWLVGSGRGMSARAIEPWPFCA